MTSRPDVRGACALHRFLIRAAAGVLILAATRDAFAANCGDAIDGARVACSCGDVVTTDTVLWPTDPVVTETCPADGLTVLAADGADGITLNLGGQSISGRGHGTGIRVARGGRLGAVIVGGDADDTRAEVAHFGTGIRASGRDVVREIRAVDVHDNAKDGLSIHASGVSIEDVRSESNGRTGVSLSGHGNEVSDVKAGGNSRDGMKIGGSAASVSATTMDNGRNGAVVGGRGHSVGALRTARNGGAGVVTTGEGHAVSGMQSAGNGGGNLADPSGAAE
jgi:hypothetical protein